jgi:hypothetical protein
LQRSKSRRVHRPFLKHTWYHIMALKFDAACVRGPASPEIEAKN